MFLEVSSITHPITLLTIMVPKGMRRTGVGSTAVRALCDFADACASDIVLSPDDCFGTPKTDLVLFYERFGFRLVDSETMRRPFQAPTSSLGRPAEMALSTSIS